ncbi:MAG: sulfurtransferase TusA family protein [Actinomycetia bacterium]|nr:sulfurtransferase TusA family protein [Actinomycetes bacterium]
MIEIDVRGLSCPMPVMKTKKALEKIDKEDILIIADSAASRDNIIRLLESKGVKYSKKEKDGEFHIIARKKEE